MTRPLDRPSLGRPCWLVSAAPGDVRHAYNARQAARWARNLADRVGSCSVVDPNGVRTVYRSDYPGVAFREGEGAPEPS